MPPTLVSATSTLIIANWPETSTSYNVLNNEKQDKSPHQDRSLFNGDVKDM
ncbi:hypothetical protein [Streptomyces sp. NPDC048282]|uniref:hypothetical protein n=1 Tax=Streptomyces sp. NPDC048282 TaxID=3365528 RepID=UPI00371B24FC